MRPEEIQNRKLQDFKEGILDVAEKIGCGETGYTRKALEENCKKNILPYEPILLPLLRDIYIKDYFENLAEVWVRTQAPYETANILHAEEENVPEQCPLRPCKENVRLLDCLSYDWRKAYRGPEDIQRDISSHPCGAVVKPAVRYCLIMAEKITNYMEALPPLKEYLPAVAALLYLKFSNRELGVLYFPFESPSIGENGLYRGSYLLKADAKRAKQAQELFKNRFEKSAETLETGANRPKEELVREYLATLLFLYILFHNPLYEKLDIEVIQKNIEVFDWYTFGLVQALVGDYPDGISPSEAFVESVRRITNTIFKNSPKDGLSSEADDLSHSYTVFNFFATRRLQYGEVPNWSNTDQDRKHGMDTLAYCDLRDLKELHPYLLKEQLYDIRPISDYFDYLDTDGQMEKV